MSELLKVENLHVNFHTYAGEVKAVRGVSFSLEKGEVLAIVGESGCGKTVTSKAIMRLLDRTSGEIEKESVIELFGKNMVTMPKRELNKIRGKDISMIFQDSMTSLNPTMTVGKQIMENILVHEKVGKQEAKRRALELLKLVEIPNAEERLNNYPHQMSGGMRQRAMIAVALACNPKVLIADEPTTALDVTIQAQLMDLLKNIQKKTEMAVILVTHDLGVVANFADRVQVMYAGAVMERGSVHDIFKAPRHPYTWALLSSMPGRIQESKSELYALRGTPPDLRRPIKGCPFAERCEYRMSICLKETPEEFSVGEGHSAACWLCHPMAPKVEPPKGIGGEG